MIKRNIERIKEDTLLHYPVTLLSGPRQIGESTRMHKCLPFSNTLMN